jgi:putative ABC transport system permease protein
MDWHAEVRRSLAEHGATDVDPGIVEELAQHAETAREAAAANVASGLESAGEADERVQSLLGTWCAELAVSGAATRPRRRRPGAVEPPGPASGTFQGLAADVRFALRLMWRHPGFALGAAGALALGIAAATTLASLAYGVLLAPLPWREPADLVQLTETREGSTRLLPPLFTNATYHAWREQPRAITGIAVYNEEAATLDVGTAGSERVRILAATASLFPVLGVGPALGRLYSPADEDLGREPVAVLSWATWQRRFGGDPAAIGRRLRLDGKPHTVVGVLPAGTEFPGPEVEVVVPLHVPPVEVPGRDGQSIALLGAIGRLAPGVSPEQAAVEGSTRGAAGPPLGLVGMAVFGAEGPPVITATPLVDAWTAEVRPGLLVLLAAAGLLLAIAVANVAGMQLARSLTRRREVAIRAAVGAGGGRIARQLLVENALLGMAAGFGGLLLAWALHRLLPALLPGDFPRLHEVRLDARVAVFALGVALLAGTALGLFPMLLTRRLSLGGAFARDGRLQLGKRFALSVASGRTAVMTLQVAVSLVLLVAAGLLVRTFWSHWHADRGYQPRNLLTALLPLPHDTFDGVRRAAVVDEILERVAGLPGVEVAAATNVLPLLSTESLSGFTLRGPDGVDRQVQAATRHVSPDFFPALGTRLLEGRLLAATDTTDGLPVIVVNRTFVDTFGLGIGATVPAELHPERPDWRIVGIVEDVRKHSAADEPRPEIFASYRQLPEGFGYSEATLVVRTQRDPRLLAQLVRTVVGEVAPSVTPYSVMTMEERLSDSLARPRLYAVLLGAFAFAALVVTGVGLFGVLSYSVAQRWHELGVRAALGATPRDVARLVIRQGLRVTAAGIALGLAASLALRHLVGQLLYGVGAGDLTTWTAAVALLVVAALLACLLPARRAARVDPLRALGS